LLQVILQQNVEVKKRVALAQTEKSKRYKRFSRFKLQTKEL
jgi:hypothetical protein